MINECEDVLKYFQFEDEVELFLQELETKMETGKIQLDFNKVTFKGTVVTPMISYSTEIIF